jgi:hypothetical protein
MVMRWLQRATPDIDEARAAFTRIVNDGSRAGEVIESIRAMFKNVDQEKTPIDINSSFAICSGLCLGSCGRTTCRSKLSWMTICRM